MTITQDVRRASDELRQAFLETAAAGYEDAAVRGLCREGAWEAALSAMRTLDVGPLLERALEGRSDSESLPDLGSMCVRDVMTAEAGTLRPEDELSIADDVMRLGRVRHLPVVDEDGVLCGIVSQRDLLRSALLREPEIVHGTGLSPKRLRVSEVMTRDVVVVEPEACLRESAGLMFRRKLGCLPVVEQGKLIGIVTEADFVRLAFRAAPPPEDAAAATPAGAAAATGVHAAALLESSALLCEHGGPEHFRKRAHAIARRAAVLRTALATAAQWDPAERTAEAVLDIGTRCAQAATLAEELRKDGHAAARLDAAAALRLATSAAECALDFAGANLSHLDDGDLVRNTKRRIWRSRLLLRRAHVALRNSAPERDQSAGVLNES